MEVESRGRELPPSCTSTILFYSSAALSAIGPMPKSPPLQDSRVILAIWGWKPASSPEKLKTLLTTIPTSAKVINKRRMEPIIGVKASDADFSNRKDLAHIFFHRLTGVDTR
jgi:hypothetical protein